MYAPVRGIEGFIYSARPKPSTAVSSRTRLQKGQHIEVRMDAIVAVLASESSLDRFWFFQLAVDVIADETDWVTKRL